MSYYGYVERENAAGVNWQEVGANLSKTLLDAGDARQAKRDAFDESTRLYQETLNNAPSGDFKTANAFALGHAADASRMRLIQDRLLKSGVMKDRDYTVARQNLTDGTKQLFGLSKEYQAEYTNKMERLENGESQVVESWLMAQIEGLSNLKNSQSYINSEDGSVSIGKMVDAGNGTRVMSKDPNDFMTVNQLRNRYKQKYDVFDVSATMTTEADRLGTFITSVRAAGGPTYAGNITKLLDSTKRGTIGTAGEKAVSSFLTMEKDMINSYVSANPLNGLSVLTNSLSVNPETGKNFMPTFDKDAAAKDPNLVLLTDDGSGTITPEFSKKQKDLIFKTVQTNFRNKIDREETISTYNEPKESTAEINKGDQENKDKNVVSNLGKLFYGDDAGVQEAADFLRGINTNIDTIDRTGDDIIITYLDGRASETRPWLGADGTPLDQSAWITANANFFLGDKNKITDINTVLNSSGLDLTKKRNETSTGFSAGDTKTQETVKEAYRRILNKDIDGSRAKYTITTGADKGKPVDDANAKMVKDFKDTLPADFTLTEIYGVGDNVDRFVKVKMKGGGEIEIDITKSDYAEKIKDFIMKSQENEAGMKTQALATNGKRNTGTTKRTGRGTSGSAGGGGTTANAAGAGSQYNGKP
tara:strand:- start:16436 stop:18370 length:1935 start_codon:yes stop_codon:yes gene_type:complete